MIRIIIASTRIPKVEGVRRAVETIAGHFGHGRDDFEFVSIEAKSGVPDTPTSIDELISGSRHRARSAFRPDGTAIVLSIGVEGGLFRSGMAVFLQSWSCVFNGREEWFGSSGAVQLPEHLASMVLTQGMQLSEAIDRFAQQSGIRDRQGTYGILTDDIVTREDSFAESSVRALLPIFHRSVFAPET